MFEAVLEFQSCCRSYIKYACVCSDCLSMGRLSGKHTNWTLLSIESPICMSNLCNSWTVALLHCAVVDLEKTCANWGTNEWGSKEWQKSMCLSEPAKHWIWNQGCTFICCQEQCSALCRCSHALGLGVDFIVIPWKENW